MEEMKKHGKRRDLSMCYSNLDHTYTYGLEKTIEVVKNNPDCYFTHPSMYFFGMVWFEDGMFYEEVWRFHEYVETLCNDKLDDLIKEVNLLYGGR